MKGGQSKEAKAGPLAHCCRLKVIEASKCIDYDAKGAIERIAKELGAVRNTPFVALVTLLCSAPLCIPNLL